MTDVVRLPHGLMHSCHNFGGWERSDSVQSVGAQSDRCSGMGACL